MKLSFARALLGTIVALTLAGCQFLPKSECEACAACTEGVPITRAALVGDWVSGSVERPMTVHLHGSGGFTLVARKARGWTGGYASGHWTLVDREFRGTIDSSGIPSLPRGHEWRDDIVLLSQRNLVLMSASGNIEAYRREGTR